ncbi:MAG: DHA2 family efflux MFS transporter permease subunit [Alphaproteobacteria bacterium]|nr:DHA2 family efflux MFS transporter permease subunit [Alphaproteobacteria bacterium]
MVTIVVVLAMANFLAILDITIVNVLVPHIAGALAVASSDGTWVITSYAVAEAVMVPLTGWLAERFGPVRVFVLCIAGFGIVSVLCGLATSLPMLIVFRIMLGICGGPLIPLSQTLLLQIVPPKHEIPALAAWSMTTILAPVAGPALGGLIGDLWSWPWAFYIKAPLALPLAFAAWAVLSPHETPIKKAPIDFVGLGLLVVWVGALQVMLGNGQNLDWFNSNFIVGLLIVTVIGFVAFIVWELTEEEPIVNLRIFSNRAFSVSMVVIGLAFGGLFGAVVLVPLWLQTSMGYTATLAGYNTAFAGVVSLFLAPITAKLMTRIDHRLLVMAGLLFAALSTLMRVFFNDQMTFEQLLWPQVAQGLSFPLIVIPLMDMSVSSLPPQDTASGAGQFNFIRTLSSAISTALVVAVWSNAIDSNKAILAAGLNDPAALLAKAHAGGFTADQARNLLDLMVQGQSVMLGTNQTFFAVGVVLLLSAAIVWVAPRPPRGENAKPVMH